MNRNFPISISNGYRLQWEPAQDCHVLLYPEGLVKLNQTAGLILTCVDGKRNLEQLVEKLQRQFPGADLEADVLAFLNTALENKWIRIEAASPDCT